MSLTVRTPLGQDEVSRQEKAIYAAFGSPKVGDDLDNAAFREMIPDDHRLLVEDNTSDPARVVAGLLWFDGAMSLPGGARVPVSMLSGVGVMPGDQGKGALRLMMREYLQRARDVGAAGSVLMASSMKLYGRYGYGVSTQCADWDVASSATGMVPGAPLAGSMETIHERDDAVGRQLDSVWERAADVRAGSLSREPRWWRGVLAAKETWLGGGEQLLALHRDEAGDVAGYVLYKVKTDDSGGHHVPTITIVELVGVDAAAELALFAHVAAFPWARRITWAYAPLDPPALSWLADPRAMERRANYDFLWLRLLDLPEMARKRTFGVDGRVRLDVHDDVFPDLGGRWDLVAEGGRGVMERGTGDADLRIDTSQLAELWLGNGTATHLASVGRLAGSDRAGTADASRTLDRMLFTGLAPRCMCKF